MSKIAKISSFFIGFCFITCTLWYPLITANEPITARIRQVEGGAAAANTPPPEDINQKPTELLGSEDNPEAAVEPTQEVPQEDSEVAPNIVPNVESENAAAAADTIKRTNPDELSTPEKLLPETPIENPEVPLKNGNGADSSSSAPNVPLSESAVNHHQQQQQQQVEDDKGNPPATEQPKESTQTADPVTASSSSDNQIPAETVEDPSATLKEKVDPVAPKPSNEEVEKADAAEKAEANAGGGEKAEEFPSYTEWTKKVLAEEKDKQDNGDQGKASTSVPQKQKMRNNYASADCGAKIVLANPEAENTKFVLNGNPDEYMINPCQSKKWFIVELCETIQIKNIETASLELFSSRPKSFRFSVSDRYPSKEWQELGTFDSTEERTVNKYQIAEDNYSKFIKVDILDHYGGEHFCPLTLFRVFGFTIEEDIDGEPATSQSAEDEDDDVESESPPNLFNSAKDTVLRLVKHVLTTTNEQAGKDGTTVVVEAPKEEQQNTTAKESDTAINPPNVTIPCKGEACDKNVTKKNTTTNGTATTLPCIPDAKDQRPVATPTPVTTLPIQPEEPQGSIDLTTNATIEYPADENLVTKLEDYEQVPVSSEEEPIVKLIGCDEQLPLFTVHTSACMFCSLRKNKKSAEEALSKHPTLVPRCLIRPSHTAKCKFLRIISDIFFKKQQGALDSSTRQEVPPASSFVKIDASSTIASSSSSSWTAIKESQEPTATEVPKPVETDASVPTLSESASGSTVHDVPSLQPSSDVHHIPSSETVVKKEPSETLESSQEGSSEPTSATAETSQEQKANLTTPFTDKLTSTLIASSQLASSVSASEDIDFRTPAETIYIEPSSTSIKELELQHVVSSERSPSDPLSHKLTPTSSVIPDKQVVASSIKSDVKDESSVPESNIITTASLPPADGELTEPAAASIEPTRVSEAPSKVPPPESLSVTMPVLRTDQKMSQPENSEMDAEPDSKGRPLYTLVRVGLPPAAKRESAIMRLNNRIKALELNVSLSSRFLDELSQRYRKQSEEMMNFLNRTVARLRNATKKTEETVHRHEVHLTILEARLDNLTQAVSKLSDTMDELTRNLTDRQMVWASIEMAILTLIFVVCLKKRQPSLPPSLVAKVLEDLLQQNSSHSRRRNSDSEILQLTPNHREVVRQRSADDLACPKSVDIVEPEIPFLLGQMKEGHKKKKRKKNKSVDLKLGSLKSITNGKSVTALPDAHRTVSTTQLNSAGLLFLGLPEDSSSSPLDGYDPRTVTEQERKSSGGIGAHSRIVSINNCSIMSSRSDPDLYSPYQPPPAPPLPPPPAPPPPPFQAPQDRYPHFNQSVMSTNSSIFSSFPPVTATAATATTPVFVSTHVQTGPIYLGHAKSGPATATAPLQAKSGPLTSTSTSPSQTKGGSHIRGFHHHAPISSAVSTGSRNLHGHPHRGALRHSASLPEAISVNNNTEHVGGGAMSKPVAISAASGGPTPALRNRIKTVNNVPRKSVGGRCTTPNQVPCSGFRKY